MKKTINSIIMHKFFRASSLVFFSTAIFNAGNYLYHLLMGRMLGPDLYGVLESTISALHIFSVPVITLTLVIVKFVSSYKGKNDLVAVFGLYHYLTKRVLIFAFLFMILLVVLLPSLISFLHLPSTSMGILLIATFFFGLLSTINRSILQGLSDFLAFASTNIVEVILKVGVAVTLVYLGMKAEGALAGFMFGGIASYIVTIFIIRKLRFTNTTFFDQKKVVEFAIPAFFTMLATTSLFSTDILLVRHFFPGVESGYYAAISVLGKIIYFAVAPIALAMVPFVSEHHAKGEKYQHFFLFSIGAAFLGAVAIVSLYFLIPETMVLILFGKEFLSIAPFLGFYGIFIGIYSICALFANFFLSIHKTKVVYFMMGAVLLQIILIVFFHNTLFQVIQMSIISVFVLLISLLLYYPHVIRSK